jgi:hypothetical protein
MKTLLIIHANSWSDKTCSAKPGIEQLIRSGDYDTIIEVASKHPEAYDGRYLVHHGTVLEHQGISPVSCFESDLFGENALFPIADEVTIAGGVFNATGGGCLNCAFDCLVKLQRRLGRACIVDVPISATYRAGGEAWDELSILEVVKDIAWKMLVAGIPFVLAVNLVNLGATVASGGEEPLLHVTVDCLPITR